MIKIKVSNGSLDLFPKTSIKLVLNNPIFSTNLIEGDYTFPFSIPWSDKNKKIFGFVEVIPSVKDFYIETPCELIFEGTLIFPGTIKVKRAKDGKYFAAITSLPIPLRDALKNRSLKGLNLGGKRTVAVVNPQDMTAHATATTLGTYKDYDYVFFPVHNPDAYGNENIDFLGNINDYRYGVSGSSSFFENYPAITVLPHTHAGQPPGHGHPPELLRNKRFRNTLVPFPYLIYVFNELFSENSYKATGSFWQDAEIQTLTIYNNVSLDETSSDYNGTTIAEPGNFFKKDITITDHLPDIKLQDFLIRLKNYFCLGYFFDHQEKKVETIPLKEILTNPDYDDWTNIVSPGYEISQDKTGYRLVYEHEESDALIESNFESLARLNLLAAVDKMADLPNPAALNMSDGILINSLNKYYKVNFYYQWGYQWEYYSDNLYSISVGEKIKEIKTQISTLVGNRKPSNMSTYSPIIWLVPEIKQLISTDLFDIGKNETGLSLLFYRGLQLLSIDALITYPLGSHHVYDANENKIANYSLAFNGKYGTYEVWWRAWLDFLINKKIIKRKVLFDVVKLKSFTRGSKGWKKKIRIEDVNFIVKTINITLTMAGMKPADIVLAKIPFVSTPAVPNPDPPGVDVVIAVKQKRGPKWHNPNIRAEKILEAKPGEGVGIEGAVFKGRSVEGLNVTKQLNATFIYADYVKSVDFDDAGVDYEQNKIKTTGLNELKDGDTILLTEKIGFILPDPLREGVSYFVIESIFDSFQLSQTKGGAAIDLTDPGANVAGDIKSNTFGEIGLGEIVPANAVVVRTWIEKLELDQGSGSASGSGSGSGTTTQPKISFKIENDYDVLDPVDQDQLFYDPQNPAGDPKSFINGKQSNIEIDGGDSTDDRQFSDSAVTFIKTTAEREVIMKVEDAELKEGDYMVIVEYMESQ